MDTMKRITALREYMQQQGLAACVFRNPENTQYFSGFSAITYSRPIFFVVEMQSTTLMVPGLEEAHASHLLTPAISTLRVYYEHPEKEHVGIDPNKMLRDILSGTPAGSRIGLEASFLPYKMVEAIKCWGYEIFDIAPKAIEMRFIKDEYEMDCLREGGRLCKIAFAESLKHAREGISEMEFELPGTAKIFEIIAEPGYAYDFGSPSCITPSGRVRTNMPHVNSSTRRFEKGDMVIHVRKPSINGYSAELERTFFIGKPDPKAERAFKAMLEAQQTAMAALKPGLTCREIDKIARDVLRKYGYEEYAIHRVGHGQGLGRHEEPYLNFYSDLEIQPGMVFTIEPGIYIPEVGGFRHSDTLIVTETGYENTTDFRREFDEMVF